MFAYVLPGSGLFGGVKKGFGCADLLTDAGHPCVVATPDGSRPTWFDSRCEVTTHTALATRLGADDVVLFSCPADAPFVETLKAGRKIVHMQGAGTRDDLALFDRARGYDFISHGLHMTWELQRAGRIAPYVPMGIPDVFRWNGEPRIPLRIVAMPRRGAAVLHFVERSLPAGASLITLDGASEREVAETLKHADIFLAVSPAESFGLPPLEAMCAGCAVVGFPGVGGFEFMRHMDTAHVVPNADVPGLLDAVRLVCADAPYRDALRQRALAFSASYTLAREQDALLRALGLAGVPA